MKNRFYFLGYYFSRVVVVTVLLWFILSFALFSFWILLLVSLFFLFRRTRIRHHDTQSFSSDIILSPVSGKVREIYKDVCLNGDDSKYSVIRLSQGFLSGYDLLLPVSSTVENVERKKGKSFLRFVKEMPLNSIEEGTRVQLANRSDKKILIEFVPCITGFSPELWINSGDKGRSLASIGFIPFGGSVLIYIPDNSDLQIHPGDIVHAGKSVIAGMKEL
jgi:hypothetical protein